MASSFEIKSTRPSVGETIVTIVRDHIDYRKQIFKLAGSDLRRTYRASALGWSWAIIKPLVTIFVYWFAFAIGLRRGGDIEGYPFVLWLISGIVPWFYMSEMLTLGTECILRNRYLVTKMKYPVSTIPTFTSISKFSVHLILMMITILIFVITGNELTIYLVQLPFYMLCNFLFFTGYLTMSGQRMEGEDIYLSLSIPNGEIRSVFRQSILQWFDRKIRQTDRRPGIRRIRP